MSDILAVLDLFDRVSDLFQGEGSNVANVFGWREPAQQREGDRICWVPGAPGGNAGEDAPPRNVGRNPRPLATFRELFQCVISSDAAAEIADLENERANYKRVRLLYDAWRRAIYLAAHGTHTVKSIAWDTSKNERRYGAALIVVVAVEAMVPDEPHIGIPVDSKTEVAVSELDVTDTLTVSAADEP